MFSQFSATSEGLSNASSLIFRIGTDAHLYDDPDDATIPQLLDSSFDFEKVEALKRLLALIAQGADVSNFFPQVVKNVVSQSLEVKKLVYLYLLHYAEKRPNEALLSINCFQKDLSDTNPLVRAYALRSMSGIRLHVVAPLVLVAIGKCARDPSPYVRKCAAHALTKLHDLHLEEKFSALEELVAIMLSDKSPGVVGAAAVAFKSVCPNNLPLIGKNFRRLSETLPDVEEWGQIVLIEILLRYVVARHGFVRESIMATSRANKDFGGAVHIFDILTNGNDVNAQTSSQNDDVKMLLRCTSPLLWSQNSSVVVAASGVHWIMAPMEEVKRIVKPLLFVLRSSQASKYVVLCNIQMFTKTVPSLLAPYYEDFYISSSDSYQMRALKLEILSTIGTESSVQAIFDEFQRPSLLLITVSAIGLCAQRLPSVANASLEGLLTLTIQESPSGVSSWMDEETCILLQAIMSIKGIIKQNPVAHEKVIVQLVRNLDIIKVPAARALIIWISGEYSSISKIIPKIVPTLLQYLARCFTSEELETKHQILNTTAKILRYIIELAKHDLDYDIRDRARIFNKLIPCLTNTTEQAEGTSHLLPSGDMCTEATGRLFRKGVLQSTSPSKIIRFYLPGLLSHLVLHAAPGYEPLPKPCSVHDNDLDVGDSDSFNSNDAETSGGSSIEESGSNYDSEHLNDSSVDSESGSNGNGSNGHTGSILTIDDNAMPLVHLSDTDVIRNQISSSALENISTSYSSGLSELMSKSTLESWLDKQSNSLSEQKSQQLSSARVSFNDLGFDIKRKCCTLLDPANGNGLKVEYSFSPEVSTVSPLLVCVEVLFGNQSTEQLKNVYVKDGVSDGSVESVDLNLEKPQSLPNTNDVPTILPMEEVAFLDPGQVTVKVLQVRFLHHKLPIKLTVFCSGKKHSTKLWPEIGYFMSPLSMSVESFAEMESQLRGMFEYSKSCTFTDHIGELDNESQSTVQEDKILIVSRSLASKVLSNANLHLLSTDMPVSFSIDDVSGLRMRFSGEILISSKPCLITLLTQGKCIEPLHVTVKINCEETTFGLNMLNRLVALLN